MHIWEGAASSNTRLVLASSSVQAEQTMTYMHDVWSSHLWSSHSQHGHLSV